jgi:pimeloyl-ACP methyl ester carboxylesterase
MNYHKQTILIVLLFVFFPNLVLAKNLDESYFIPVNETELFIRVTGNSKKQLILYLHGGPGGFSTLEHDLYKDNLEQNYLIAYLDQRGCGQSKEIINNKLLNINQYLEDLDVVIDYLIRKYNKDKINLMGDSWGATYGFLYLIKNPSKVNSMISNGGVANAPYSYQSLIKKEKELVRELIKKSDNKNDNYNKILEELQRIEKSSFDNFFEDMVLIKHKFPKQLGFNPYRVKPQNGPPSKKVLEDAGISMDVLMSFFQKAEFVNKAFRNDAEYNNLDILRQLEVIKIPVLVIQGDSDYSIGIDQGKMIYSSLSKNFGDNKYLKIIENTGHSTTGESPKKVIPIIENFLEIHTKN